MIEFCGTSKVETVRFLLPNSAWGFYDNEVSVIGVMKGEGRGRKGFTETPVHKCFVFTEL